MLDLEQYQHYQIHGSTAREIASSVETAVREGALSTGERLPTVRELGIGFVAYSPLGRGFLSGKIKSIDDLDADDWRRRNPRFQPENFQKNLDLVARVEEIAAEKRVSPSQLALAWVLAQGRDIVPIPGSKRRSHLEENVKALDVQLSERDLQRIDEALPRGLAAGARYPDMSTVNR